MKLFRLTLRTQGVCRNASQNFFSSSPSKLPTQAASIVVTERKKKKDSSRRSPLFLKQTDFDSSLFRRITPIDDPRVSIVPVLDQWVTEGRKADKETLDHIIKSLKKFGRFKHALEISEWMTDKRYMPPMKGDIMSRLHLIYKVHGLQKAEEFYNNMSQIFKGIEVDITLLNIYSLGKSVDKAEALMQKLRDAGCLRTPLPFNVMLNLYYNLEKWDKIDALTNEMETKGIYGDKYTLAPRLNAYAATNNIEGLNKTMSMMENDPRVSMDSQTYFIAGNVFLKAGLFEKGFQLLKRAEEQATTNAKKDRYTTLNALLTTYSKLGKKDEVYRIWSILKENKIHNNGYRNIIMSLLKFDDIEGAEGVFKEWETKGLWYDFQVPDSLVDFYVKKGEMEKAESLIKYGIEKGGVPIFKTWLCLAKGFIEDNQVVKGVEALKKAAFDCRVLSSMGPVRDKLVILLEYLDKGCNVEEEEEEEVEGYLKSLETEGIFSSNVCGRLLDFIRNKT